MNNPFESNNPLVFFCTVFLTITGVVALLILVWGLYRLLGLPGELAFLLAPPTLCAPRVAYYIFKGK